MVHIKRYANKDSMTVEEKALRRQVLGGDTIATTDKQEIAALKGDTRFRLEPMSRKERRTRKKAFQAKGKGFTKP